MRPHRPRTRSRDDALPPETYSTSTIEKSGARLVSRMVIVSGVPSSDFAARTDNVYKDSGALAEEFAAAADHGSTARSSEAVKCGCMCRF